MKTKSTALIFCMLLASSVLGQELKHAIQPNTGNSLLACLNIDLSQVSHNTQMSNALLQNFVDLSNCEGYVLGVVHAVSFKDKTNGLGIDGVNPPLVCLRQGITFAQAKDAIKNYLYAHPESRDKSSSRLILAAMREAFPCSNSLAPTDTPLTPQ